MCVYSFQRADLPARNPASKWYVSRDRYPLDKWPPYCRGGMYAMPVGMAARLYAMSRRTSFLHLDDVWVTGLVRRKLGNGDVNIHVSARSFIDRDPKLPVSCIWTAARQLVTNFF